jgi:hypothetical protein
MAARHMSGPGVAATAFEWSSAASMDRLHQRLSLLDNVTAMSFAGVEPSAQRVEVHGLDHVHAF